STIETACSAAALLQTASTSVRAIGVSSLRAAASSARPRRRSRSSSASGALERARRLQSIRASPQGLAKRSKRDLPPPPQQRPAAHAPIALAPAVESPPLRPPGRRLLLRGRRPHPPRGRAIRLHGLGRVPPVPLFLFEEEVELALELVEVGQRELGG